MRHFYAWHYMRRGGRIEGLQTHHLTREMTIFYSQLAADIARRDLEMIGKVVTKTATGIEKLRFSFDKCGDFAAPREIQWPTRR